MELPFAVYIYFIVLCFIAGSCAGSFINCAAERYVAGESVLRGRSRCPACGRVLGILDLFPIFSYIFLKGRCRTCGAKIPARCLITELLGGVTYFAVAVKFGFSLQTLEYILLFSALIAIALIDGDTMEIPDGLQIFCLAVYVVFVPFTSGFGSVNQGALGAAALGGGLLVISLVMDCVLKKDTLGGGDIKMLFVLGLFLGLWKGLLMIIFACITGIVFVCISKTGKGNEFPFGPAIVAATFVVVLCGQQFIDWYLSLIP